MNTVKIPSWDYKDKEQFVFLSLYKAILKYNNNSDFFGYAFNFLRFELLSAQKFSYRNYRNLTTNYNVYSDIEQHQDEIQEVLPINKIQILCGLTEKEKGLLITYIESNYSTKNIKKDVKEYERLSRIKKKIRKYFKKQEGMATYLGI
jgi:hypothetical protein